MNSSEAPRLRKATRADLVDVLALIGFAAFAMGVGLQFGLAWALLISGAVLLAIGLVAAWRRS